MSEPELEQVQLSRDRLVNTTSWAWGSATATRTLELYRAIRSDETIFRDAADALDRARELVRLAGVDDLDLPAIPPMRNERLSLSDAMADFRIAEIDLHTALMHRSREWISGGEFERGTRLASALALGPMRPDASRVLFEALVDRAASLGEEDGAGLLAWLRTADQLHEQSGLAFALDDLFLAAVEAALETKRNRVAIGLARARLADDPSNSRRAAEFGRQFAAAARRLSFYTLELMAVLAFDAPQETVEKVRHAIATVLKPLPMPLTSEALTRLQLEQKEASLVYRELADALFARARLVG